MDADRLNVDLRTLRAFCEVAACRGFSLAAERLGVTQAAVSKSIRRLETQLQVVLFERSTRRIELTQDGLLFLPQAQRVVSELEASISSLRDARGEPAGIVRVAALAPFARQHLVEPFAEYLRQHPRVRLMVNFSNGREDLLTQGHDLCIGHPSAAQASYTSRLLCTWQYVLVASPGYLERHGVPHQPSDLPRHQCICPTDVSGRVTPWEFVEMSDASRRANHARSGPGFVHLPDGPLIVNGQMEAMVEAAMAGLGISVVATSIARGSLAQGRLKIVLPLWRMRGESDVLMLYRQHDYMPLRLRVLIDHLARRVREDETLQLDPAALQAFAA